MYKDRDRIRKQIPVEYLDIDNPYTYLGKYKVTVFEKVALCPNNLKLLFWPGPFVIFDNCTLIQKTL